MGTELNGTPFQKTALPTMFRPLDDELRRTGRLLQDHQQYGLSPMMEVKLIYHLDGKNPHWLDANGNTLAHYFAAWQGSILMSEALCLYVVGAIGGKYRRLERNKAGWDPLMISAKNGNVPLLNIMVSNAASQPGFDHIYRPIPGWFRNTPRTVGDYIQQCGRDPRNPGMNIHYTDMRKFAQEKRIPLNRARL